MCLLAVFYSRTNLTKSLFYSFSQHFLCLALKTKLESELLPVYGEDLGPLYLLLYNQYFQILYRAKGRSNLLWNFIRS